MVKRFWVHILLALPAAAQLASVLPADRLLYAKKLSAQGQYADAVHEYGAIRQDKSVPHDEVLFYLGEAFGHVGKKSDALACYAELLRDAPQSRYADYARLNRALLQEGAARLDELRALDHPNSPGNLRARALYYLGENAAGAGDRAAALDAYRRAAAVCRTNEVGQLSLFKAAGLLAGSDDAKARAEALACYAELLAVPGSDLREEAQYFVAMLYYRDGRYAHAAQQFKVLQSAFPRGARTTESRIYAAWANFLSGRYTEALELAAPLRDEQVEDAYYLTAASLKLLERRADALAAYDEQLAKFRGGRYADTAWFERLTVLAAQGEHALVLAALGARKDPPARVAARAWGFGCESAIAVTNFPLAVEYARLVAKNRESPLAPNAVHRLAWLLEKTGDWARAAQTYRALESAWPTNAVAAQALYQAGVCEIRASRAEQARADWTALLARHPGSAHAPEALYARAMEEIRAKEYRAAERSLAERHARFPEASRKAESLYWWGVAARGAGDDPEAEKHFRAALAAGTTAAFEREIKLELAAILQKRGAVKEAAGFFSELLATKAVDRLSAEDLQWTAEALLGSAEWGAALAAAAALEKRNLDAAWTQIGAALAGAAHEGLGERDAAMAAYTRALETKARTVSGAKAALALGKLACAGGLFDEAKAHLADAVERASSPELLPVRVGAYAALAQNEEERGDTAAALGYHLLVGTLFDDPALTPKALARAAKLSRELGKAKEADGLEADLKKRYPKFTVTE